MEKRAFSRGGEFDTYTPPQMDLLSITAEQGFAGSLGGDEDWGDGSIKDDWEDLGQI